jgi:glycosyltransferase involved in cell wall biosynthesis
MTAILHISESYAGGVGASIRDYVRNSPEVEHHLLYVDRKDAPLDKGDLACFARAKLLPGGHLSRVVAVRNTVRERRYAAIHAHSSFAGVYGRLAVRNRTDRPLIYTPHCYAFERRDIGATARAIFRTIEWVLALNTAVFAGCSPREVALSHWPLSSAHTVYLPNVPPSDVPPPRAPVLREPLVIAGAGRAGAQKDPDFFFECIEALRAAGMAIEPRWIGGGTHLGERCAKHGVHLTGWLTRQDALVALSDADIYVHSARWEGFPIAVLEAITMDVPTIVRSIPAFQGAALPLMFERPQQLPDLVRALFDPTTLDRLVADTRTSISANNDERQAEVLSMLYGTTSREARSSL